MKSVILTLALIGAPAFAEAPVAGNFEVVKATMITNTDKRIESLTKMKACIQGATAMEAIKACKQTHHTEMATLKDEMIDQHIQRMNEKKSRKSH